MKLQVSEKMLKKVEISGMIFEKELIIAFIIC